MTKPEAEQELAALEEKERIAWAACSAKLLERDEFEKLWIVEMAKLREVYSPLYHRKQQLKSFIEIA